MDVAPGSQGKIVDFEGKIVEIVVFARVHAIWTSMIKSLSFWRLRGGSGRPSWGAWRPCVGRLGDILEAYEAIPGRPGAPD